MCVSPIIIPNPNYGKHGGLMYLYDTTSKTIRVGCGYCKQCIAAKQVQLIQRVQMEALDSHLFFTTLTYNNDFLPSIETSTGFNISYANIAHLQLLFKRLRNNNCFGRPFRYLAVSERGKENSRPHFHILWFLPRYDGETFSDGVSLNRLLYYSILDNWCLNFGSKRSPDYKPLCTFKQKYFRGKLMSNYDTHFVVPSLTSDGISSVAFYVSKYLLKSSGKEKRLQQALHLNLPSDEYDYIWNVVKSRCVRSEHFGLNLTDYSQSLHIVDYLRSCVRRSDRSLGYACYFVPDSSRTFPLAHYYKRFGFIYSLKDHMNFVMDKDPFVSFDGTYTDYIRDCESLERSINMVDNDLSLEFNFLFD